MIARTRLRRERVFPFFQAVKRVNEPRHQSRDMQNLRSVLIFALGMVIFKVITYFFADILAQNVFGASVFYPPSPDALCFLRDP
jgi:hypothetical protein